MNEGQLVQIGFCESNRLGHAEAFRVLEGPRGRSVPNRTRLIPRCGMFELLTPPLPGQLQIDSESFELVVGNGGVAVRSDEPVR